MPRLNPQARFLLRGSTLLIGLLALWWFLLVDPMLFVLRSAANTLLLIQQTTAGDWTVRVPLDGTLPATPQQPLPQQIRSIDFDLARADAIAFTFSLPVFWAIILAGPNPRSHLRGLLLGTLLMALVEILLLLVFCEIAAHNAFNQSAGTSEAAGKWIRHLGYYMVVNVLPFVSPIILALALHPELSREVFNWTVPVSDPTPVTSPVRALRRSARKSSR